MDTQQENNQKLALAAILKVLRRRTGWAREKSWREIRMIAGFILEPYLFTRYISPDEQKKWLRLVGKESEPRTEYEDFGTRYARANMGWNEAVWDFIKKGVMIADNPITWAPGYWGLDAIDTTGWPDNRAQFIMASFKSGSFHYPCWTQIHSKASLIGHLGTDYDE